MVDNGANLSEPESIKALLASSSWANSTRSVIAAAYQKYAVLNNIKWTPLKYVQTRKLPFIPLEKEIDELIACVGRRMSVLLQCLKETGARIGEVLKIECAVRCLVHHFKLHITVSMLKEKTQPKSWVTPEYCRFISTRFDIGVLLWNITEPKTF